MTWTTAYAPIDTNQIRIVLAAELSIGANIASLTQMNLTSNYILIGK